MSAIVLSTINARYVHASLGLRWLKANLGALQPEAEILEFVLGARPVDMVEQILARKPRIVGFGVYIWNVEETTRAVAQLKQVAPEVIVVIGGPEVSHEVDEQRICALADYVITGWADVSFAKLVEVLMAGERPAQKVIAGEQPPLDTLVPPYDLYDDNDIAQRFLYVEASRGCPFKCEFCLSALDKTAWPFETEAFLAELAKLHARGARHFRFVDRTFNLKAATGERILQFFLDRLDDRLFVHFEVVPDHLPERLKVLIARFPPGSLQFEVGIQTFNPEVQARISRRQDNDRAGENILWLRDQSHAHIHADLIAGLPGEDLESFGRGFDRLHALRPHEIQVGILKRLRGTPIARHTEAFAMRYNPDPPYNILATDRMDFGTVQRMNRFARYWDMVGNSGRFPRALPLLLADAPFARFLRFTDWLFATTGKTHEMALERVFEFVFTFLTAELGVPRDAAVAALVGDYEASGAKGRLSFMAAGLSVGRRTARAAVLRQARHANVNA
jgi:radical SAM superfamily enzyme YgiQ (UPF0313 family)